MRSSTRATLHWNVSKENTAFPFRFHSIHTSFPIPQDSFLSCVSIPILYSVLELTPPTHNQTHTHLLYSLLCVSGSAEKLFNLCDEYADSTKKKVHIWPLQNAALILCPVRIPLGGGGGGGGGYYIYKLRILIHMSLNSLYLKFKAKMINIFFPEHPERHY